MAQKATDNVLILSTLSILQIIKEGQQQHGLRHGDYQRYRSYCARKLRRLRKSLHLTHGHKMRNFQHKKPTVEQVAGDYRFLLISLFEAERCWAYSMQLKQEAETEPRKRFHLISKLKKCISHGCELEKLCKLDEANVDVATKLEAQAYHSWLNGCLNFELQDWQKAQDHFAAAKTIYDNLSSASAKLTAEKQRITVDLYQQRCQEMIDPQLRYCAFKIGDETAVADLVEMRRHMAADKENLVLADIDALIAQTREKQAEQLKSEVSWCQYKIDFSKAPNKVKMFRASMKQFDAQLDEAENLDSKIAAYEQLLIDCRDAVQAVRDENKTENFKQKHETGESSVDPIKMTNVQILHSWLLYLKLAKTTEKYLMLIGDQRRQETGSSSTKQPKPQDMVRLYDAVLQNLREIPILPGATNDPAFLNDINTAIDYYNTFRCFYVAEVYCTQKKWREALALYNRTIERCKKTKLALGKCKPCFGSDVKKLDELVQLVENSLLMAHANAVNPEEDQMQNIETSVRNTTETVYIEDMKTYQRLNPQDIFGPKKSVFLTHFPPEFKPMPCKPIFFDLACNHIKFPSLDAKLEDGAETSGAKKSAEKTKASESTAASGLGGIVKGWFWGGGKK